METIEKVNLIGLGLAILGGFGSEAREWGEVFVGVFWLGLALYLGSLGFVFVCGDRS